jgi:plasmid stabilization system protein ParE
VKYTVVWLPAARNALADIWNRATDRQAVTDASNRIDRLPSRDAHRVGRPFNGRRLLIEPPLVVVFRVSPQDRLATVIKVGRY